MSKHLFETLQSLDESLPDEALKNRKAALEFTADYLWDYYLRLCRAMENPQKLRAFVEAAKQPWSEKYFSNVVNAMVDLHKQYLPLVPDRTPDRAPDLSPESLSSLIRSDYEPPFDPRYEEFPDIKDEEGKHLMFVLMIGDPGPMAEELLQFHEIYKVLADNPEFRPSYEAQMNLNVQLLTEACLGWMLHTATKDILKPYGRSWGTIKKKVDGRNSTVRTEGCI